ncbi:MAG: ATP-binding protein [Bacillota bacterium]
MDRTSLTGRFLERCRLVLQVPLVKGQPLCSAHPALERHQREVERAIAELWRTGSTQRLVLGDSDASVMLLLVPASQEMGLLLGWDLSVVAEMETQFTETVRHLSRDLFYVASQGRVHLVRREEVFAFTGEEIESATLAVSSPEDIGRCRSLVMERLLSLGHPRKAVMEFVLAVSEAVTNAVKHGSGGSFTFLRTAGWWNALVEDRGPGIDLIHQPYAMLLPGFSTQPSQGIGYGYTTMLRCVDRLVLDSGPPGLTLLLQKSEPRLDGRESQ